MVRSNSGDGSGHDLLQSCYARALHATSRFSATDSAEAARIIAGEGRERLAEELLKLIPDVRPDPVTHESLRAFGLDHELATLALEVLEGFESEGLSPAIAWDGLWVGLIEGTERARQSGLLANGEAGARTALRSLARPH